MVKQYSSEELREMTLTELKDHAKKLKKAKYDIGCYSTLKNNDKDLKKFRSLIRKAYKAGPQKYSTPRKDCSGTSSTKKSKKSKSSTKKRSTKKRSTKRRSTKKRSTKKRSTKKRSTKKRSTKKSSSKKSSSKKRSSKCKSNFKNKTECVKHTDKDVVRQMSEECGLDVDNLTKLQQCEALFNDVQKGKEGAGNSKNPYKDKDGFKDLMKNTAADLRKMAVKKKLDYVDQDGKPTSITKARKESIAIALYKKKKGKNKKEEKEEKKEKKEKKEKDTSKSKHTEDELSEMSPSDLRKILKKHGIKKGVSKQSKDALIQYVLAVQENDQCDPVKGKWCKGDLVCDASNTPGVCISKDYVDHHAMDIWNYKGHQIIGSKDPIESLKKKLKPKMSDKDKYRKKKLVKEIIKINREDASKYDFYTLEEVRQELFKMHKEESSEDGKDDSEDEKDDSDDSEDEKEEDDKTEIINAILYYTGEGEKERLKYEKYTIDQLNKIIEGDNIDGDNPNRYTMTKFIVEVTDVDPISLREYDDEFISEAYKNAKAKEEESSDDDDDSSDGDEPLKPSKEESSDDDEPSKEESSDDDDDSSDDDDDSSDDKKLSEGTEIPDFEAALANAISGGSKIGDVTKSQRSIIKCLGLMSSK